MDDRSLMIKRCQKGDRQAWGQLYAATRQRLLAVCRSYVNDDAVAEDLLHDAYVLILSHVNELKEPSKADAWMTAVARNVSLLYLRERKDLVEQSVDTLIDEDAAIPVVETISYEQLLQAIDALPDGCRQVFRLSVFEGLSHEQIAGLLHINPHTSSSQLFRARLILRRSLGVLIFSLLCVALPLGLWYYLRQTRQESPVPSVASVSPVSSVSSVSPVVPASPVVPVASGSPVPWEAETTEATGATEGTAVPTASPADTAAVTEQSPLPMPKPIGTMAESPVSPVVPETLEASADEDAWTVALAYNGVNNQRSFDLPYATDEVNDEPVDTITRHSVPVTIALSVNKMLGSHWSLGTGLQYTWLKSETQIGNTVWQIDQCQRINYLGIPLRLSWYPVNSRHWRLTTAGNLLFELPVYFKSTSTTYYYDQQLEYQTLPRPRLHPQWSLGLGLGVEYRFTPMIGFYVEPGLQYYFGTGDGINTWRTEHPLTFTLPFGLRVTF